MRKYENDVEFFEITSVIVFHFLLYFPSFLVLATWIHFLISYSYMHGSLDSSVGTATDYGLDMGGCESRGEEIFLCSTVFTPRYGAHPASCQMRTGGSFPRGKAAEAWSWPPTSIQCQDKERWNYTSIPPYVFMAWWLINWAQGQLYLLSLLLLDNALITLV
jgi:hypothetical protein